MARPISGRFRGRLAGTHAGKGEPEDTFVEIETAELSGIFAAPSWLRDLGVASWLLVGVAAFLAGAIWLLALTQTIVVPVITAAIIASVISPLVGRLEARGLARSLSVVLVFLVLVVLAGAITVMVLSGVTDQAQDIGGQLSEATSRIAGWLEDAGIEPATAEAARSDASASVSDGFQALLGGVAAGISTLAGIAVFLSFTALALFFLLKDGPMIATFVQRNMGIPEPVAKTITTRTAQSLQGYFFGMTIVSLFSATIVGATAWLLGVDLAGTIFAVTFLGGYVPYLGAWTAGAFAVLIALGSSGPETAAVMAVITLLANGILQQLVQPIAYGATLGIHPLAVLVVTIAGGSMFGTIGLILAAPLTAAGVRIAGDLGRARAQAEAEADSAPDSEGGPAAAPPAPA